MNPTLQQVIELQKLDTAIQELQAEVARLPSRIAEIERTLNVHIQQVESDKNALAENQKSRRRRENEISALRDKIAHYKDQTLQVKTNEQYRALLHEIEFQEAAIRKIEDQILSEMVESEALERRLREAEQKLAAERAATQKEVAAATERKRLDEEALRGLQEQRAQIEKQLPREVLETYQRVARARKGLAVAAINSDTCSACHVHLRPQVFSEIRANERVICCESCGRILYFVPEPSPIETAS